MTYRDYFESHPEENLSWCRPYHSENGRVALAMNEGYICALTIDGEDVNIGPAHNYTEQEPLWERVARASIEDEDLLDIETRRYTWREIALMDGLVECGCASCPFADICDVMSDEMETPEEP